MRAALDTFKKRAHERYNEGTLLRLLESKDVTARRASLLALELLGGMSANESVAARLHDDDAEVRQRAVDAGRRQWPRRAVGGLVPD